MSDNITIQQSINSVSISSVGFQGPPGPQGPPGAAGGSAASFSFEQQTNSTTWVITHNLGYRPAVFATDYGGNILEGDILHNSVSQVTLTFNTQETGYAYLS